MDIVPVIMSKFGAWGQIVIVVFGVRFYTLGMVNSVIAAGVVSFLSR